VAVHCCRRRSILGGALRLLATVVMPNTLIADRRLASQHILESLWPLTGLREVTQLARRHLVEDLIGHRARSGHGSLRLHVLPCQRHGPQRPIAIAAIRARMPAQVDGMNLVELPRRQSSRLQQRLEGVLHGGASKILLGDRRG
jgi:hypothetical protein